MLTCWKRKIYTYNFQNASSYSIKVKKHIERKVSAHLSILFLFFVLRTSLSSPPSPTHNVQLGNLFVQDPRQPATRLYTTKGGRFFKV